MIAECFALRPGLEKSFCGFSKNHTRLLQHFVLTSERETVLAGIRIDEQTGSDQQLIRILGKAVQVAKEAKDAGVATDDVLKYCEQLNQSARGLTSQSNEISFDKLALSQTDKIVPLNATPKQRLIGSALGFLERASNLVGTSVTLGTASYPNLTANLAALSDALKRMIGL